MGFLFLVDNVCSLQCYKSSVYFQTESPSGASLTLLGAYLLLSLVFVFFTIVEFALVLVLKGKNRRRLQKKSVSRDEPTSKRISSRFFKMELKKHITNVSSTQEMTPELDGKRNVGKRTSIVWTSRSGVLATLPLTKKIDIFAFGIYHISFLFFNLYYWTNLDAKQ